MPMWFFSTQPLHATSMPQSRRLFHERRCSRMAYFRMKSSAAVPKVAAPLLLAFCRDLAEFWQAHGKNTMLHTAKTQPTTFFAVCARLIPNDVRVTVELPQPPGNLSMED